MYTFSFIVGHIIPKSVKCIHSATKVLHRLVCPEIRVGSGSFQGSTPSLGCERAADELFGRGRKRARERERQRESERERERERKRERQRERERQRQREKGDRALG